MVKEKVLLCINNQGLENFIMKQLKDEFEFLKPVGYRAGILSSIEKNRPNIVVIVEELHGKENMTKLIYEIFRKYNNLTRIIFIANERQPGDKLLSTLINYKVYDLIVGDEIDAHQIIHHIRYPNEYMDVMQYHAVEVVDEEKGQVLYEAPDITEMKEKVVEKVVQEIVYVDPRSRKEIEEEQTMQETQLPVFETSANDLHLVIGIDFDGNDVTVKDVIPNNYYYHNGYFFNKVNQNEVYYYHEGYFFNANGDAFYNYEGELITYEKYIELLESSYQEEIVEPQQEENINTNPVTFIEFEEDDTSLQQEKERILEELRLTEQERLEQERIQQSLLEEQEKLEQERLQFELEQKRLEQERMQLELEQKRLEQERLEKERLEQEKIEFARKVEAERLAKERVKKEQEDRKRKEQEARLVEEKRREEQLRLKQEKETQARLEKQKARERNTDSNDERNNSFMNMFGGKTQKQMMQAVSSSNKKLLTFIGSKGGAGTSTIAFNTAVALANQKKNVLYVEYNYKSPVTTFLYNIGYINKGIDTALTGIKNGNLIEIENAIIRFSDLKQKKLEGNPYKLFPETLNVMMFSKEFIINYHDKLNSFNESFMKELFLYFLFQSEYDYIVFDMQNESIQNETVYQALFLSEKIFMLTLPDISYAGYATYHINEWANKNILLNNRLFLILNRYEKGKLSVKEFEDWLEVDNLIVFPEASKAMIEANYIGVPLVSGKNNVFKNSIMQILSILK